MVATSKAVWSLSAVIKIERAALANEPATLTIDEVQGMAEFVERFTDLQLAEIDRRATSAW